MQAVEIEGNEHQDRQHDVYYQTMSDRLHGGSSSGHCAAGRLPTSQNGGHEQQNRRQHAMACSVVASHQGAGHAHCGQQVSCTWLMLQHSLSWQDHNPKAV